MWLLHLSPGVYLLCICAMGQLRNLWNKHEGCVLKVLLLVMDEQRVILDSLYDVIKAHSGSCDVVRLSGAQQSRLAKFFRDHDYRNYDRVVIFSRLKRQRQQINILRCIPGLIFLEHDACQNYMESSKYKGAYSSFYKRLPWIRVLSSGFTVAKRLRAEGIDAVFVSKGYDERLLQNTGSPRDIDAAFLGSVKSGTYRERKKTLEDIAARTKLLIARTSSGAEYAAMLNRVRIFVSADVGMSEYMIKNFEAMACGCVLLACSQGAEEDAALGFEDGKNVMLYRSVDEAVEKIEKLKADPALTERIARAGQELAEQRYTFARVGRDLAKAIEQPMRPWPGLSFWQRSWVRLRYGMKV